MTPDQAGQIRSVLLGCSQEGCVARELWSCGSGTYTAYRKCIAARKQQATEAATAALRQASSLGGRDGGMQSLPATVKYSFEGVKHVLAEAAAAVTVLAFASLRNDLLAFGCVDGELWLVCLPSAPQSAPTCVKARKMHAQAVLAVDWAYDNSQLMSVGHDGSLCVWDTAGGGGGGAGGLSCIRSISVHTTAFQCGRFHRVNFSLAMVGTSAGSLDVYNCSTGMLHSRYQVTTAGSGLQVTALDSSNHHVFAGDSSGTLHMLACEMHERQLSRLRPTGRLRLPAHGLPASPVTALQYVPFCKATDTPVLMAALQDGSLCIVRANEARHTAELHLRRFVSPPSAPASGPTVTASSPSSSRRPATVAAAAAAGGPHAAANAPQAASCGSSLLMRLRPSICPLSVISEVPLITYGSDDTSVYIVDVTARSYSAGVSRPTGGGGAGSGAAAAAAVTADRPMTVTVLKAHRAAVTAVAWSYDEALLASADADGTVVIWQRCRLF